MLQKSVGLYPAIGIPGQQVAFNQASTRLRTTCLTVLSSAVVLRLL